MVPPAIDVYTVKCVIIGILFLLVFAATFVLVSYTFLPFSLHEFRWLRIYWTNIKQNSMKADTSKSTPSLAFLGYPFSAVPLEYHRPPVLFIVWVISCCYWPFFLKAVSAQYLLAVAHSFSHPSMYVQTAGSLL